METKNLHAIGRTLYALPLGVFAFLHFAGAQQMQGLVPDIAPGNPVLWVYITGLVLAASFLSLLTNRYVKEVSLTLAGMLLIFILTIHVPATKANPQMGLSNLLKDTAMMGAALTFAAHHGRRENSEQE